VIETLCIEVVSFSEIGKNYMATLTFQLYGNVSHIYHKNSYLHITTDVSTSATSV
jgi:hypothetical protein